MESLMARDRNCLTPESAVEDPLALDIETARLVLFAMPDTNRLTLGVET